MKKLLLALGCFICAIVAITIVSTVRQAMRDVANEPGKVKLVGPVASIRSGRCVVWGSTYRKGQSCPFYDKLWLMSGESGTLLSNSRESSSRHGVSIKNPVWDPSGDRLVWLKFTESGDSLVVYDAKTRRTRFEAIPNRLFSTLFGSATATRNLATWPSDKWLSLNLLGWYPDGKHVMLHAFLLDVKSGKPTASSLWKVGIDRESAVRAITLNPSSFFDSSGLSGSSVAFCSNKTLFVTGGSVYASDSGKGSLPKDLHIRGVVEMIPSGKDAVFIIQQIGKHFTLLRLDPVNGHRSIMLESDEGIRHIKTDVNGVPFVELADGKSGYAVVAVTSPGHASVVSETNAFEFYSIGHDNSGNSVIWLVNRSGDKVDRLQLDGVKVVNRTTIPLSHFQLR